MKKARRSRHQHNRSACRRRIRWARWTSAPGGPAYDAYSTNYLVDTKAGVIVDVEATPANRGQEVAATKTMTERAKERFELSTHKLNGDTASGGAEQPAWMVNEHNIEPHVPVWDRSERTDGTYSRSNFTYDERADAYVCPNGKQLLSRRRQFSKPRAPHINDDRRIIYRASELDCRACPLREQRCPKALFRKLDRSIHEAARDIARAVAQRPDYRITRRHRKKVEILFGHMKRILKLDRLRLRGISGARDEFLLTAFVRA